VVFSKWDGVFLTLDFNLPGWSEKVAARLRFLYTHARLLCSWWFVTGDLVLLGRNMPELDT
jgi:hypothetical protein